MDHQYYFLILIVSAFSFFIVSLFYLQVTDDRFRHSQSKTTKTKNMDKKQFNEPQNNRGLKSTKKGGSISRKQHSCKNCNGTKDCSLPLYWSVR